MVMKKTHTSFGTAKKPDRELLRARLTEGLSQGQAGALMVMIDFLTLPGPDMFVLKGYAGTGKTFIVKKLIEYITNNHPGKKIAITAPTNKAVQVLLARKEFTSRNVSYQTIHSLLALTETITTAGQVTFTAKKGQSKELSKISYLIVDEVSMLQDEIFKLIQPHSQYIKIIFIGDPAQIPPIGKTDCIPFKRSLAVKYEEGFTLTQIMRQAEGNPIIEASFKIRDNLQLEFPIPVLETKQDENGHGLIWVDSATDRDSMLMLLEKYFVSQKFIDNPDYAKLIAWRNKTVNSANTKIRGMIYGEQNLVKIMPGEKLLANRPIFDDDGNISFNTSEQFQIESYNLTTKTLSFGPKRVTVRIYDCVLDRKSFSRTMINNRINVLHEDSEAEYTKLLEELKQRAVSQCGADKTWVDFYDAMKWPAGISYNYAISAHKAQGSTYENVFLMEDDLNANKNTVERNRIKYTAYSRASHKLYVYRKNPF